MSLFSLRFHSPSLSSSPFFFICFVRDDAHPKVLINLTGSCLTRLLSFCRRSSAHWAYSRPPPPILFHSHLFIVFRPWILNFISSFFLCHWLRECTQQFWIDLFLLVLCKIPLCHYAFDARWFKSRHFFFRSFFPSSFSRSSLSLIAFPPFSFLLSLDRFSLPLKD